MATAEVSIIGLGRSSVGASEYIAEMHRRLERQDRVRFKLNAMGTELQGTLEDILDVVRELHRVPLQAGLPRVYTVLKIDERTDRPNQTLEDKVRSVKEKVHPGAGAGAGSGPGAR